MGVSHRTSIGTPSASVRPTYTGTDPVCHSHQRNEEGSGIQRFVYCRARVAQLRVSIVHAFRFGLFPLLSFHAELLQLSSLSESQISLRTLPTVLFLSGNQAFAPFRTSMQFRASAPPHIMQLRSLFTEAASAAAAPPYRVCPLHPTFTHTFRHLHNRTTNVAIPIAFRRFLATGTHENGRFLFCLWPYTRTPWDTFRDAAERWLNVHVQSCQDLAGCFGLWLFLFKHPGLPLEGLFSRPSCCDLCRHFANFRNSGALQTRLHDVHSLTIRPPCVLHTYLRFVYGARLR